MLLQLWRRRELPGFPSRRWVTVWVKRVLSAPALVTLLLRHAALRVRGARLGDFVVIESARIQGRLVRLSIGAESFIGRGVQLVLHEEITIGCRVVINSGVTVLTASHLLRDPAWRMYRRPVSIGDYAWIATGAMLLPGVHIGRGAVVGAGAVVRSDVPDFAVVAGNPAVPSGVERCRELDYNPVAFVAPLEAWWGPPQSQVMGGSPEPRRSP